jgi:hypothetical protein
MAPNIVVLGAGGGFVLLGLLALALHGMTVRRRDRRSVMMDAERPPTSPTNTAQRIGVALLCVGFALLIVAIFWTIERN